MFYWESYHYVIGNLKAHFSGLGIDLSNKPHLTTSDSTIDKGLPNFVRETAVRWLQTIESEENLPADLTKLEQVALERLGLSLIKEHFRLIDIPAKNI